MDVSNHNFFLACWLPNGYKTSYALTEYWQSHGANAFNAGGILAQLRSGSLTILLKKKKRRENKWREKGSIFLHSNECVLLRNMSVVKIKQIIPKILEIYLNFETLHYLTKEEKSRIQETPNLSTDAIRSTDTEKNIQGFFLLLWGICLSGSGLLCTLQQSPGLHIYPLNYTALLSYAVHCTEKF